MQRRSRRLKDIRINTLLLFFLFVPVLLILRLFQIQVLQHSKYRAMAQEQYWNLQTIPAKRGDILSSDGYPLATTQVSYLLYIEPKEIVNKEQTIKQLATVLSEFNKFELTDPYTFYEKKISDTLDLDLYWVKIQNELTPEQKDKIESLNIEGIGFEEEPKRYYPEKTLTSHVLGFVAHNEYGDPQGYFGIEGYFDGDLKGKPGRIIEEQDALGAPILAGGYKKVDSTDGSSIVLTINRAVQYLVESRLSESVEKYGAKSGSVIVMDPFSGDVIAMANYPTYDPANFNDFGGGASEVDALGKTNDESDSTNNLLKKVERTNLAISQTYEPGSVIKGLTVSSAVDLGIVSPDTTFVDAGPVQYSDYVIDNWDSVHHGVQTIVQLLQKSNNIGAAWVGHKVGAKNLSKYFKSFGLGEKTNIDLEGEDTGIIRDYSTWTDIDIATVAFGQGISATPLQVLNGFNAIANGGRVMRPRIVKTIVDGDKVIEMPVTFEREVISKKTSDTMIDMLTKAVSGGESRYFNIKNYNIAGKTGTAQIPEKGTYNPNKTNATFVGFLSTSKRFSIIVKLEEPQSSIYAAETAAPLFMRITEDLVKYYGIPPDKDPTI